MKTCTKCHQTKPPEEFYPSKLGKGGLTSRCKTCQTLLAAAWNNAHPEKRAISKKASDKRCRARVRAYHKQWRLDHPESVKAYYRNNIEEVKAQTKAYAAKHPEQSKIYRNRRRALKANAPLNDLTHAQWLAIQAVQNHRCAYCGKRCKGHLTQDHITPLSKGGSHTLHNVIGACRRCNSRKHAGPILAPVQPLLL